MASNGGRRWIRQLGAVAVALFAVGLLAAASSSRVEAAAPLGTGKTVAYALSRSGSAGVVAGDCGTRLQCFKTAIAEANTATAATVENAALVLINVDSPDQDVNLKLTGKQLLIPPDADPNVNGKSDFKEALDRVSLGGGTCYTCALQAAKRSFQGARSDSQKVIVLVSERENTFRSTGFTSSGTPTGYEAMELSQMAGQFDANTVVRAFAVGPRLTCSFDPNGYGSLNDAAAVTPGGTCTNVASFDGLGALLTEAVVGTPGGAPDTLAPSVTLTAPTDGSSTESAMPRFAGAAGVEAGDLGDVTVKIWEGTGTSSSPLQTLIATVSNGLYEAIPATNLAAGSYTAQAEQRDAAGNVGRSAAVAFTVASSPAPPSPPTGPDAYAQTVRADSPSGYWRLGELSGTAAAEDQGRANGTYSGGVVLGVPGATRDMNAAARFDGGNDKLAVPDPASGILDFGADDFTVEAWIKTTSADERAIVAKRSTNAAEPYWAVTVTDDSHHNGQIRAAFFDGTTLRIAYSTTAVLDDAWHHVVVWFDRDAGVTVAVDGVKSFAPAVLSGDVGNSGELQIGKAPTHNYFRGDIDEVAVYRGLLPLERIQAHAAAAS